MRHNKTQNWAIDSQLYLDMPHLVETGGTSRTLSQTDASSTKASVAQSNSYMLVVRGDLGSATVLYTCCGGAVAVATVRRAHGPHVDVRKPRQSSMQSRRVSSHATTCTRHLDIDTDSPRHILYSPSLPPVLPHSRPLRLSVAQPRVSAMRPPQRAR
jgi:hypothetical protein